MKVECVNSSLNDVAYDLSQGEHYEVIAIEAGDYRILDDTGRPYLFPVALFKVIDSARPDHWNSEFVDGAEHAAAPELATPGFFEDYFGGRPEAVRTFNRYLNRHIRITDIA